MNWKESKVSLTYLIFKSRLNKKLEKYSTSLSEMSSAKTNFQQLANLANGSIIGQIIYNKLNLLGCVVLFCTSNGKIHVHALDHCV